MMKTRKSPLRRTAFLVPVFAGLALISCGDHGHDHSHEHGHDHSHGDHHHHHDGDGKTDVRKAGPNGGRILSKVEPHLEFFVTGDRKARITALNESLEPVPMADQVIRITAGDRTNPVVLELTRDDAGLISETSFPEGDDFPVVVQISNGAGGSSVFEKFTLDLSPCPTCDHLEYACTCDHGHEH